MIDVDEPGTGRIPRTLMRPFNELQPESKIAFARASEELKHRSGMKAGGITPSDLRDVGLSLMFVHRMDEVLDSSAQAVVKLEVFSAYVDYTVQCRRTEMDATGLYRTAVSVRNNHAVPIRGPPAPREIPRGLAPRDLSGPSAPCSGTLL